MTCPYIIDHERFIRATFVQRVGDADDMAMSFGALVSTSNEFVGEEVIVQSDVALVWTTEIRTSLENS